MLTKEGKSAAKKPTARKREKGVIRTTPSVKERACSLQRHRGKPDLTASINCNGVIHMISPEMSNA